MGCMILLLWCYGMCLFVWTKYRINFTYILELDPRSAMHYTEIFAHATNATILFQANFIIYFKAKLGSSEPARARGGGGGPGGHFGKYACGRLRRRV